jgi:single-strand DNA-binding protein
MDLNKVQLIWRSTQDIELKTTPNWQNVASLVIATNRTWNDSNWHKQESTEYNNVVLWWKIADIAQKYLKKWKKVYIEWRLHTRSWDWNDWVKKYKTEIIWENIILLDSKNEEEEEKKENKNQ